MHAEGFFTCFQGAQSCSEEQTTCSTWHAPLYDARLKYLYAVKRDRSSRASAVYRAYLGRFVRTDGLLVSER